MRIVCRDITTEPINWNEDSNLVVSVGKASVPVGVSASLLLVYRLCHLVGRTGSRTRVIDCCRRAQSAVCRNERGNMGDLLLNCCNIQFHFVADDFHAMFLQKSILLFASK